MKRLHGTINFQKQLELKKAKEEFETGLTMAEKYLAIVRQEHDKGTYDLDIAMTFLKTGIDTIEEQYNIIDELKHEEDEI